MSGAKTDGGGGPHFTWLGVWLLAMLGGSAPLARGADTLISTGAVWKYLDTGVSQGTNWRRPDFDDSAWTNGPAQKILRTAAGAFADATP